MTFEPIPKSYTIPEEDFVVFGDVILREIPRLLNDRAHSSHREVVEEYFTRGFGIFTESLREIQAPTEPLTPRREKELLFMLGALISAKRMLEEGQKSS